MDAAIDFYEAVFGGATRGGRRGRSRGARPLAFGEGDSFFLSDTLIPERARALAPYSCVSATIAAKSAAR